VSRLPMTSPGSPAGKTVNVQPPVLPCLARPFASTAPPRCRAKRHISPALRRAPADPKMADPKMADR